MGLPDNACQPSHVWYHRRFDAFASNVRAFGSEGDGAPGDGRQDLPLCFTAHFGRCGLELFSSFSP